ncbi:MAG: Rieske (2Fe-2S) domain-containing protein [Planctomycetota bacterium]|nr:MAG: Rieske (2Fe-2S) domain-containing protein [Planctomycetota bacterium]
MSEPKLSTAEILAKIRAAKSGAGSDVPAPVAEAPVAAAAEATPAPAAPKAAPAVKPGSTGDILAAIRAQGAKGAVAPAAETAKAAPAPKPAAAKSGSTSDILAAIRAGKAGAAPASDAPVTSAAPASKPAVAAAVSGEPKPSLEEMLKAVRGGAAPTAASAVVALAVPVKPALPPIPVKPPAAKDKKAAAGLDRRSVIMICLSPLFIAFGLMAVTALNWVLALARFMFPNVLVEPPTKFKIGPPSDYPLGGVSTKWLAARGVWIVHTDQYKGRNLIYALASVCTHLGCTPNWLEGEQKYKCPCHGSGFYVNGVNFEGPAPRPLERVGIKLASDGQLEVDKSVKFQEEMGQWEDSNSFVDGALA